MRARDLESWVSWFQLHQLLCRNIKSKQIDLGFGPERVIYFSLQLFHHELAQTIAKETVPHRFFSGKLDLSLINPDSLYFLLVRSGLEKKDLLAGKYGFQDKVFVKASELQQTTCQEAAQEMENLIRSTMRRETSPYVIFSIQPSPAASFNVSELYTAITKVISDITVLGTILDVFEEKRIYFCLRNDLRGSIDLHLMSVPEAHRAASSVLQEAFRSFARECIVITGKGNHVLPDGSRGILKEEFRKWIKSPDLALIIQRCRLTKDGGRYEVQLKPPERLMIASPEEVLRHVENINREYRCDAARYGRFIIKFADFCLSQMFQVNLSRILVQNCPFIQNHSSLSHNETCYHYPGSVPKMLYQTIKPDGSIRLSWLPNKVR